MSSSRCSSPPPENVIRLEDLIKKCPGAPKRNNKKKRPRGEDGSDDGSGTTTIGFDPIRSDGRGGDGGGDGGGDVEDERTPPESPVTIRPQRLFHEDNDACMELSRILDFSDTTTRAAPQDAAEGTRKR